MAASLHYLTVQDMLWINVQVTSKVNKYNYANLEEATYYQYAYRDSDELIPQAARFLGGFVGKNPFDSGNDATAFVAVVAFLRLNGFEVSLQDSEASGWFGKAKASILSAKSAIDQVAKPNDDHHDVTVQSCVKDLLKEFPKSIEVLGGTAIEILVDAGAH